MIRALYSLPGQPIRTEVSRDEFPELLKDPNGVLWLDFSGEPPEVCQPILEGFGFHPLAIDDALQETHLPKVDDWEDYLYVVFNHMHVSGGEEWETTTDELDAFLGENYLVTHHDSQMEIVDEVWNSCVRDDRHTRNGPDHVLYRLADALVNHYMPLVERIDVDLDELEDSVFVQPGPETLAKLFALKRLLLTMRRITMPQREVLNKLARDDYKVIDARDRIFFRDIYDHLVRLHDLNETLRDLIGGVQDTYLSVINNRMNEVMKTLTIITTMFMPITFITGFFGMNFFEPVAGLFGWTSEPLFVITVIVLIVLPLSMFLWMRRRTWL
jgi:magnesium transporter